eukprot:TRINITY_DN3612_c0_g1_i1.p1 TRINITY_DN3612_c0_g1~~TRINITY_DN3612_c0_g1_i1.p1  ORF type:complete len:159 (+),score=65.11 TRINITY_DN3612_c0_g1_i1:41-517(+)
MAEAAHSIPDFKWAQNKEVVFLTFEITDAADVKTSLKANSLSFSANGAGKSFSVDLNFLNDVDVDASKIAVRSRGVELVLKKKNTDAEFWPHLLSDHKEWKNHCHVDWSKWVDEDEEQADPNEDWRSRMADFNPIDFPQEEGDDEDDDEEEEDVPAQE